MAGGAEIAAFTGKSKKIFMLAISAPYPGKPIVKYTAVKILV